MLQSFLNQLVYFAYFQCLFILLIYLFSPERRKNLNSYVAIFVFILMIGLTGRVTYLSGVFGSNYRLVIFSEFATLLFGATVFLFTRSALLDKPFSKKDLVHYAPAFFYNIFVILVLMLPSDEVLQARRVSGEYYRNVMLLVGIGLVFNISYWVLSLRLFLKFRKDIQNEISFAVKSQFFLNFLIAVGLCLLSWLSLYLLSLFGIKILDRIIWQIIWQGVALIILFIAFYTMKEPDLFKIMPLVKDKKYLQSKLSTADLDQLKAKLDQLMLDKKPFLNRKLLKSELAEMLGVSKPEIARLLNENIGMNFFEYINYHRIKEFVALAKTEEAKNMTFFGLAQQAGFNSKTTFNKSFKNLMGTTPKEYFSSTSLGNN